CILILFSILGVSELLKSGANWIDPLIGSLGNIIGGIIGGIVAYIVASYQTNKTLELQEQNALRTTYTMLRLIREEINYNCLVLDSVTPFEDTEKHREMLDKQLQNAQWFSCSTNIGPEISDQTFLKLCDVYRHIGLLKASQTHSNIITLINDANILSSATLNDLDAILDKLKTHVTSHSSII
ncbi:hypothetical protein P4V64_26635, partial [Bacillus thuringiensis]|nr:hypothetical protein [Bacillus thuringiensis]